jgi:cyanophycin synthetase
VPAAGQTVVVKTVVNDNARRRNAVVTDRIGDELRADGARATAVLGTALAAVDIITPDPCVSLRRAGGVIVEVNTTPGLHHHYNVTEADSSQQGVAVPVLKSLLGLAD